MKKVRILTATVLLTNLFAGCSRNTLKGEIQTFTCQDKNIKMIFTDAEYKKLNIQKSDTENIIIKYDEFENDIYNIFCENNILTIQHDEKYSVFSTKKNDRGIEVFIPKNFSGDIDFTTENSTITAKNMDNVRNVAFTTSNGIIKVADSNFKDGIFTVTNGKIDISNITCNALALENSNGKVIIDKVNCENTHISSSSGIIQASKLTSLNKIFCSADNGRIDIANLKSAMIELQVSDGSINCNIDGVKSDYEISVHASNGSSNIENKKYGPNRLSARTTNGNINISFKDDVHK